MKSPHFFIASSCNLANRDCIVALASNVTSQPLANSGRSKEDLFRSFTRRKPPSVQDDTYGTSGLFCAGAALEIMLSFRPEPSAATSEWWKEALRLKPAW